MIYVFDPDEVGERRDWSEFLARDFHLLETLTGGIVADAIVFVHGSYLTADRQTAFAENNPLAYIVVISGGERPAWWSDSNRAYWRRSPVGKPSDAGFGQCVQRFLASVSGGKHFSGAVHLLEPINADELWALHVLCEASQMAEINPDGQSRKPTDWLEPFDQRPRPGGLFDKEGMLVHQQFMQARQSSSPEPTASEIADCLKAVIDELSALRQI